MIAIACDPGYERLGIAVLEGAGSKAKLLYSDCFKTEARDDFEDRLLRVGLEIKKLIGRFKPEVLAIETLLWGSNQKTAMRVAEVRGALIFLAKESGLSVAEYSPGAIKSAVTGDGRADKNQIISMVPKLVKISKKIKYDDEYDAIAAGLTALACFKPAD